MSAMDVYLLQRLERLEDAHSRLTETAFSLVKRITKLENEASKNKGDN